MINILVPETASAPPKVRSRYFWRNTIYSGLLAAIMILANMPFAEAAFGEAFGERAVLAILPFLVLMTREFVILMQALDELQFRIHMTALAIAGGVTVMFATSVGMVDLIFSVVSGAGLVLTFPVLLISYYLALFFVGRHYT